MIKLCRILAWTMTLGSLIGILNLPLANISTRASGAENHVNCGINTAYTCLRLFGLDPSLTNLAQTLHVGAEFERHCTLADLKRTLEGAGLSVTASKVQPISEIPALLDHPGRIIVLRLQWPSVAGPAAHFCVLTKSGDDVVVIDPPEPNRRVKCSQLATQPWFLYSTGEILMVEDYSSPISQEPLLVLDAPEVDCGTVRMNAHTVEAIIGFNNRGARPLKILKTILPCVCIKRTGGTMEVPPGVHGSLTFQFDKSRLHPGFARYAFLIKTNDPIHPMTEAKVRMYVEGDPAPDELRVSPQTLSFGRQPIKTIGNQRVTFTVTLPDEHPNQPTKCVVQVPASDLTITKVDDSSETRFNGHITRILHYRLSWKTPPTEGEIDDSVRFTLDRPGEGEQIISVPVTGDAVD